MITKETKEKWIAALRSGKFKQTTFMLSDRNPNNCGYCCLGVLSKICDSYLTYEGMVSKLDATGDYVSKLMNLNDRQRMNFEQIADWIQENVKTS